MVEIAGILPDTSATDGLGYFRKQNNPYNNKKNGKPY